MQSQWVGQLDIKIIRKYTVTGRCGWKNLVHDFYFITAFFSADYNSV